MNLSNETSLSVVERGAGVPVIMLHGLGVDHRILLPLDEAFQPPNDWLRIYVDLPGMGGSPADGVDSADATLDRILRFIDRRLGGEPFGLLGNSFGGMIARGIAADLPDQVLGLCLICPVVEPQHELRTVPVRTVLHADSELMASLPVGDGADYAEMAVVQSRPGWESFQRHVLPGIRAANDESVDRISQRYGLRCDPAGSGVSNIPTLIILGRQDHVVGYFDALSMADLYPRATVAVLDRAGHNVHLEQPAVTRTLIEEWLLRVTSRMLAT